MTTEERFAALEARVTKLEQSLPVDDSELDGKFGNPTVRRAPKRWLEAHPEAPSYEGKSYSQCPPAFLTELASFLEWTAAKDQEKGEAASKHANGTFYWKYSLKDAKLARGWAKRNASKPSAVVDDPFADRGDAFEPDPSAAGGF